MLSVLVLYTLPLAFADFFVPYTIYNNFVLPFSSLPEFFSHWYNLQNPLQLLLINQSIYHSLRDPSILQSVTEIGFIYPSAANAIYAAGNCSSCSIFTTPAMLLSPDSNSLLGYFNSTVFMCGLLASYHVFEIGSDFPRVPGCGASARMMVWYFPGLVGCSGSRMVSILGSGLSFSGGCGKMR